MSCRMVTERNTALTHQSSLSRFRTGLRAFPFQLSAITTVTGPIAHPSTLLVARFGQPLAVLNKLIRLQPTRFAPLTSWSFQQLPSHTHNHIICVEVAGGVSLPSSVSSSIDAFSADDSPHETKRIHSPSRHCILSCTSLAAVLHKNRQDL